MTGRFVRGGLVVAGLAGIVMIVGACVAGAGPVVTGTAVPTSVTGPPTPVPTPPAGPVPVAEITNRGTNVPGSLGTWTLDGRGSDTPWQPFTGLPPLELPVGHVLPVRFVDGAAIGDWSVALAAAEDTAGLATRGVEDSVLDAAGTTVAIGPMPGGRWVVMVRLIRADGRGDGSTYWAITVR